MRHAIACSLVLCTFWLFPAEGRAAKGRPRTMRMEASAFVLDSKPTAAGTVPHAGIVAADPAVLPLGSRVRISGAGAHSGVYTVTDTGAHVKGRRIDIYMTSAAQAKRFGRKMVTVQVLEVGKGKEDAQDKSIPAKRKG